MIVISFIFTLEYTVLCSRYSDWVWAGRSRDRIPLGARFSAPIQTSPWAHPTSCLLGTGPFLGVKSGQGVTLSPHPLLVPWSRKSRAKPLLPLWAVRLCTEPQCLYKGALNLFTLMYFTVTFNITSSSFGPLILSLFLCVSHN
jgi:hypothetical protein